MCIGLVQVRDEHTSYTKIEPVYCYDIDAPEHIGNTWHCNVHTRDTIEVQWGCSP